MRVAVRKTLLDAALTSGGLDQARTLLSARTALRPKNTYEWLAHARFADALGDRRG